jgi:DNA-binding IclR family transcriptional regulator
LDIDRLILPYMKQLSEEIGETVDLSVRDGDMMVFIDQIAAENQRLMAISAAGHAFPIHTCANGKAVLAGMDEDKLDALLTRPLKAFTKTTIASKQKLKKELASIREAGFAIDAEEHQEGICAVGAQISAPDGQVFALSVPVPSVRFYGNENRLAKKLIQYCRTIEKALGGEA